MTHPFVHPYQTFACESLIVEALKNNPRFLEYTHLGIFICGHIDDPNANITFVKLSGDGNDNNLSKIKSFQQARKIIDSALYGGRPFIWIEGDDEAEHFEFLVELFNAAIWDPQGSGLSEKIVNRIISVLRECFVKLIPDQMILIFHTIPDSHDGVDVNHLYDGSGLLDQITMPHSAIITIPQQFSYQCQFTIIDGVQTHPSITG